MTFQQYIQKKNLDISIISFEEIIWSSRIDSECYSKYLLITENNIKSKNHKTFFDLIKKFNSWKNLPQSLDWKPFLRTQNIIDVLPTDNWLSYTDKFENLDLLKEWDLLFVRVWVWVGDNSVVYWDYVWNAYSDNLIRIKIDNTILNSFYVSVFFSCDLIRNYFSRYFKWTARPLISKENFKDIKIPIPSTSFQTQIANLVQESFKQKELSKKLYLEAEKLLLSELWLDDYVPTDENISIKDSEEVELFWRVDAEFFQPKYDEITYKIQSYKWWYDFLRNLFKQNRDQNKLETSKINYIEIWDINISNWEIIHNEIEKDNLPANAKILLKKDDLLVSTVRPYRWAVAIVRNETKNLVWSWAFTVLREKTFYKKETLEILLKLNIYKELMLRYNCWASYPVIKDEDILNLPIPKVDIKVQEEIAKLVKESHKSLDLSKQLLEKAKKSVEIFIEEDEEKAIDFLND